MDFPSPFNFTVGSVEVHTSSNGGLPPEFWAERIVRQLIIIGDQAPMPIREQAYAFRARMQEVVLVGLKAAIENDRAYRK